MTEEEIKKVRLVRVYLSRIKFKSLPTDLNPGDPEIVAWAGHALRSLSDLVPEEDDG